MELFGKELRYVHVYQYRIPKRKGEVRNNLEEEELLADKSKKKISEEFLTDNRHDRCMKKIKKELRSRDQKCELHIKPPGKAFLHQPSMSYTDELCS